MDLSFYPPDVRAMMEAQLALDQQSRAQPAPAAPPQAGASNPLLVGNDALRQQFAAQPELAPPNAAQWLNDREAHLLGNDSPPDPAPGPDGMDPGFYKAMLDAGAQPHQPVRAPDQPGLSSPFAPPPTALASAAAPAPYMAAPSFPAPAAPVLSSLSSAPAAPARANIDNNVTLPAPTFTAAPKLPELPKYGGPLTPNMGAYSPAPSMPGYGLARTGSPYRAPQPALPALPTFAQLADPGFQAAPGLPLGLGLPSGSDLLSGPQTYLPQPVAQEPLYPKLLSGKSLFA